MEVILDYKNVNGTLLRYIPIDLNRLFKYRDSDPKDSSVYNWVIPNIYYNTPQYCNYIGKDTYYEKFDFQPYSSTRAINHRNDALYHAVQEVGPEKCTCNIVTGISNNEAEAMESLLLRLDTRYGMSYGQNRWEGEPLLNKRNEDVDMELINKYFDLDGNNYIETFRRKMYRY